MLWVARRAQPVRARDDQGHRHVQGRGGRAASWRSSPARPSSSAGRCRGVADQRPGQEPGALPADQGQGPLRRRPRRGGRGRRARAARRTRPSSSRSTTSRSPSVTDSRRPSTTARRSCTRSSAPTSRTGSSSGSPAPRRPDAAFADARPRQRSRRVLPRPAHPERDGAARRAWPTHRVDGRVHACTPRPRSRTSCAPRSRDHLRHPARPSSASSPRTSAAGSAPSSRSTPEEHLPGAGQDAGRPVKWIEDALRGLLAPTTGVTCTRTSSWRRRGRHPHGGPGQPARLHGRLPADDHARAFRCWARSALRRLLRLRRLRLRVHRRVDQQHATDAYRGAGRPEATYAIERADGRARARAGHGPDRAPAKNFITADIPEPHDGRRADGRLGQLRRAADKCSSCSTTPRSAASRPSSRASGGTKVISASGSPRTSRCAASRRRGCWPRSATSPAAGTRRRSSSCPPARSRCSPASRRTARATRRRWPRSSPTSSACRFEHVEVLHGDTAIVPLGLDTYGSRARWPSAASRCYQAGEKIVDKARTIAAHQLEAAEDDLEFADGNFTVKGTPTRA